MLTCHANVNEHETPTYKNYKLFACKIILTYVYRYLSASARTFAPS